MLGFRNVFRALMSRDAARQGASSKFWAERSATRGEIRLRSHYEGLRYGGRYSMVVEKGRIDALVSRKLRGRNGPSMTDNMERGCPGHLFSSRAFANEGVGEQKRKRGNWTYQYASFLFIQTFVFEFVDPFLL